VREIRKHGSVRGARLSSCNIAIRQATHLLDKVCDFNELKLGTIFTDGFGRAISIVTAAKMTTKKHFEQTTPSVPGFYAAS
jgi:hypothetical protein